MEGPRDVHPAYGGRSADGLVRQLPPAYAVFGLVIGTIYDTEEPYKITYAERPVTFLLHVLSVATLASVLIDLGFNIGLWNQVLAFFRQG